LAKRANRGSRPLRLDARQQRSPSHPAHPPRQPFPSRGIGPTPASPRRSRGPSFGPEGRDDFSWTRRGAENHFSSARPKAVPPPDTTDSFQRWDALQGYNPAWHSPTSSIPTWRPQAKIVAAEIDKVYTAPTSPARTRWWTACAANRRPSRQDRRRAEVARRPGHPSLVGGGGKALARVRPLDRLVPAERDALAGPAPTLDGKSSPTPRVGWRNGRSPR
jgi:hypothetical protein